MLYGSEQDFRQWFIFFTVSIVCHIILFTGLIFSPVRSSNRRFSQKVIHVDLVSVAPTQTKKQEFSKPDKQLAAQKKSSATKVSPEKKVAIESPKKKIKQSLKKKTFQPSKVVKSALSRMEKHVKESRPESVTDAIDRLRTKVGSNEKNLQPIGELVGPRAAGKKTLEQKDIYNIEIKYIIRKNWVFSEKLAGGRVDLEVTLGIKIMPDGEISKFWFDKKSGNNYFDESAYRAVMKSNPLPPLPKGMPFHEVGLIFTPSDLKENR